MELNRRTFLGTLVAGTAGAVAGLTFDPERLLWVPGAKTIFLPPVARYGSLDAIATEFAGLVGPIILPQLAKSRVPLESARYGLGMWALPRCLAGTHVALDAVTGQERTQVLTMLAKHLASSESQRMTPILGFDRLDQLPQPALVADANVKTTVVIDRGSRIAVRASRATQVDGLVVTQLEIVGRQFRSAALGGNDVGQLRDSGIARGDGDPVAHLRTKATAARRPRARRNDPRGARRRA